MIEHHNNLEELIRLKAEIETLNQLLNVQEGVTIEQSELLKKKMQELQETIESLKQEIRQRKETEDALRESEAQLRTVLESVKEGVIFSDEKGHFEVYNSEMERLTGYSKEEANLSEDFVTLIYPNPKDRQRAAEGLAELINRGKPREIESVIQTKNGQLKYILVFSTIIPYAGRRMFLSTYRDITARKKIEEEMKSLAKFPLEDPSPILRITSDGRILFVNPVASAFLLDWCIELGGQAPEFWRNLVDEAFKSKEIKRDVEVGHKGRIYSFAVVPVIEGNYVNLYGQDITERKNAEKALIDSEKKYRHLYEGSQDGFVRVDMQGNILEFNNRYCEMLGYSDEELYKLTHVDLTPEKWHQMEARIVQEQILSRGYSEVYQKEYKRKDGTIFPIELRTYLIKDEKGCPVGMWAFVHDITNRKIAEEKIKQAAEEWQRTFNAMSDMVSIQDQDFNIIKVNESLLNTLKVKAEDILGKKCYDVLHKTNEPWHTCPFVKTKSDQCSHSEEVDDPAIGMPLLVTTSPIFDDKGEFIGTVHVASDITLRKKAEKELLLNSQNQIAINKMLYVSLLDIPMEEMLRQSLEAITSVEWLGLAPKGCVFLVENDPDTLVMKAEFNLSQAIKDICKSINFGRCLCGKAAQTLQMQFADCLDERHENRYEGISNHGHYCTPIVSRDKVIGVLNLYVTQGHRAAQMETDFLKGVANILASSIERKLSEKELKKRMHDLEVFNKIAVDRELKMVELKKKIRELEER